MFWKRGDKEQKDSKLKGPRDLPAQVSKQLVSDQIIDPDIVRFLKAVTKGSEKGGKAFDVRIFDPSEAEAGRIKVENYTTLNENPDLIIAEGWFDEDSKKVELTSRKVLPKIKFFTLEEITQQIEGLKEPGSSVFFLTNAGTGVGGPLGRGAALIKVNAPSEKKQRKYSIYGVNVFNMQPTNVQTKIYDSDKPVEIARWVSDSHKARFC